MATIPSYYGYLDKITDPSLKQLLKNLLDQTGALGVSSQSIGTVTQPLKAALNASGNHLSNVKDPAAPQDAATKVYVDRAIQNATAQILRQTAPAVTPPPPPSTGGPITPPTPSPPTPPTSPPSSGTFSATDMLDLTTVTILASPPDIATWPQTATLSLFDWQQSGVQVTFDKQNGPGRWPDVVPPGFTGPIEYTLWWFTKVSGTWYGAGFIQYWNGLLRNGGPPSGLAANWTANHSFYNPMTTHQPAVGEQVGFMVSAGNARNQTSVSSVKERSQTILIPMPNDNGVVYT